MHRNVNIEERLESIREAHGLEIKTFPDLGKTPSEGLESLKLFLTKAIVSLNSIQCDLKDGISEEDSLTGIATLLATIVAQCYENGLEYGIHISDIMEILLDSNESKLGTDGKAIFNEKGEALKGPYYWKPEPMICKYLKTQMPRSSDG